MTSATPDDLDTLPPELDPATGTGTLEPPRTWWGTLLMLGPGLVIAGSIVGSGELIATTKTGAQAAGQKVAEGARSMKERVAAAFRPDEAASASGAGAEPQGASNATASSPSTEQPAWAKRLHRRQQLAHAATTAAHTLRGGDGGSSSQGPSLRSPDE